MRNGNVRRHKIVHRPAASWLHCHGAPLANSAMERNFVGWLRSRRMHTLLLSLRKAQAHDMEATAAALEQVVLVSRTRLLFRSFASIRKLVVRCPCRVVACACVMIRKRRGSFTCTALCVSVGTTAHCRMRSGRSLFGAYFCG